MSLALFALSLALSFFLDGSSMQLQGSCSIRAIRKASITAAMILVSWLQPHCQLNSGPAQPHRDQPNRKIKRDRSVWSLSSTFRGVLQGLLLCIRDELVVVDEVCPFFLFPPLPKLPAMECRSGSCVKYLQSIATRDQVMDTRISVLIQDYQRRQPICEMTETRSVRAVHVLKKIKLNYVENAHFFSQNIFRDSPKGWKIFSRYSLFTNKVVYNSIQG